MAEGQLTNEALINRGQRALVGNYRPQPLVIAGGEGARVFDIEGNRFIDFISGIAVSSLGYGHPRLTQAIADQAGRVLHTSNVFWNQPQIELAEKIAQASFGDRVMFCNSGAEANEAMLKLARKVFHDRGEGRFEFICMEKSFHGRTMATVTCTGQEKYRVGFEPLLPGVRHVPYGDLNALEASMSERTAAILLEPIQGEGGVRLPPPGYMRGVRDLCSKHGCLMLLDEVQSGVGRTGRLWAHQHEGVEPDIMSLAKGLGGGMPIGAIVTHNEIAEHLTYGSHGSTFGGNPVACAAANVVMDEVSQPAFLERVHALGDHLLGRLQAIAKTHKRVVEEARGRGLWCGLELTADGSKLPRRALTKGLVLNVIGGRVVRIAPPLVIDEQTIDDGLNILEELLREL
jgi:predicted acetylornithine/succinylornithine family transaminase